MTVSVLIPAKGLVPYLEESLESVFASSLKPDEILLVDDGIDSFHLKKIKTKFSSPILRIIKNDGTGIVEALNTGIYATRSSLIARLDSDDYMSPERLLKQAKFMTQSTNTVVAGSQITFVDTQSRILGRSKYPNGVLNLHRDFYKRSLLAHPSVIIRRSALLKVDGYRTTMIVHETTPCEDFDLWRRIASYGDVVNLDSYLTFYRQHQMQISRKNSSPQSLATFIISMGYFDGPVGTVSIRKRGSSLLFPDINKIRVNLSFVNKIILNLKFLELKNVTNHNFPKAFALSVLIRTIEKLNRFNS
jgi:glycosyltransferase involved in cell wall biosynthesis